MTNFGVGVGSAVGELCGLQAASAIAIAAIEVNLNALLVGADLVMWSFYDWLMLQRETPRCLVTGEFLFYFNKVIRIMASLALSVLPALLEELAVLAQLVQHREQQWLHRVLRLLQSLLNEEQSVLRPSAHRW